MAGLPLPVFLICSKVLTGLILLFEPKIELPNRRISVATSSTLPSSSDNDHLASRIFVGSVAVIGVITVGGILAEGRHYGSERDCKVELCSPADQTWLPHGEDKEPSNPVSKLPGTTVTSSSSATLTPSNSVLFPTK
jgi:hypothetical protein